MYFSFWQVADRRLPALKIKVIMFAKHKKEDAMLFVWQFPLSTMKSSIHVVHCTASFSSISEMALSWERSWQAHLLQKFPQDGDNILATFLLDNISQVLNRDPLPATPHLGTVHSAAFGQTGQENCRVPIYYFYQWTGGDSLILSDLLIQLLKCFIQILQEKVSHQKQGTTHTQFQSKGN